MWETFSADIKLPSMTKICRVVSEIAHMDTETRDPYYAFILCTLFIKYLTCYEFCVVNAAKG
jgi:hypothetical protein